MGLVRILMFVMNFVLWGIGGTLLGIGIWLKVDPNALDAINIATKYGMDEGVWNASVIIMIVVGALVFVVGFLGCLGAMQAKDKPKNFFLKLYFVSVKIIIILEIVCIILAAVFWNSLTDSVRSSMANGARTEYVDEAASGISQSWNNMQVKFKCCGGDDFTDYKNSRYFNTTDNSVPWTCCVMTKGAAGDRVQDVANITSCRTEGARPTYNPVQSFTALYPMGCYDGMKNEIESNSGLIIGLCSGFIALEIVGYIFACLIMRGGD